jgi:hypothetical protein
MEATKEQVWEVLKTPKDVCPNPKYGDLFTKDEFVADVRAGAFIPSDGTSDWATLTHSDPDRLHGPSPMTCIRKGIPGPAWATHVLWFNK